jgi:hypothetical protein
LVTENILFSEGTHAANLYAANDANGNPLQNPTVWNIVIDASPPGNVADALAQRRDLRRLPPRRFGVDNIRAASLTAHYWRGTVGDSIATTTSTTPGADLQHSGAAASPSTS